ncbi:competence/damage-inducible protein A [Salisaeta longa]|uniref:competence/damage-inducible protein A n=1 Tax=Salisaeta longa TaxID=503170 RepID=UPI0003B5D6E6|nr:competence/damage-inducible protein A [Salisaeta longa]
MDAHLLTIGDELLMGQTVNTNAAWLGEQLSALGVRVRQAVTVGDAPAAMHEALDRAAGADLVITTGGLGPTHDDITKQVVAAHVGKSLHRDEGLWQRVQAYYTRRDRSVPAAAAQLADVPDDFELLDNPTGTAPGLWYDDGTQVLVVLPGVPQEMKAIFRSSVKPRLEAATDRALQHRTLLTTGVPESSLQEKIGDLTDLLHDSLELAYLPSTSGVRLRLTAEGPAAAADLDRLEEALRDRIGRYIFGTGDDTLEAALGRMLRDRGLTVATAESCTGGLVARRLTRVPGSSRYFLGSIVAYANDVKERLLDVSPQDLQAHGAVSEPVARQMAAGARAAVGADVAVSTTGIAGPTGGSDEKPVGTIWVGYADAHGTHARRLQLVNDRILNQELFSTVALDTIRRHLLDDTQANP